MTPIVRSEGSPRRPAELSSLARLNRTMLPPNLESAGNAQDRRKLGYRRKAPSCSIKGMQGIAFSEKRLPPSLGRTRRPVSAIRARVFSIHAPSQQQVPQDNGVVMDLVMGREHERDGTLPCSGAQFGEKLRVLAHFAGIAASELLPTSRIVSEPLSQRGAGRDDLEPFIDRRRSLCHAAGPKPVDQYPGAVIASGGVVCPFQPDIGCGNVLAHLRKLRTAGESFQCDAYTRWQQRPHENAAQAEALDCRQTTVHPNPGAAHGLQSHA